MQEDIEPMSKYKWNVLAKIAEAHGLGEYFAEYASFVPTGSLRNIPDAGLSRMQNIILNERLKKIRTTEPLSKESSIESLNFLDIIVQTTECILTYGLHFANIVRIGKFLREDGDKVDFIKFERWLDYLHLSKMAQLEVSILVNDFAFQIDEIPFISKVSPDAEKLAIDALTSPIRIKQDELHIENNFLFFTVNNKKTVKNSICNYKKYFQYAPIEVISCCIQGIEKTISTIEE